MNLRRRKIREIVVVIVILIVLAALFGCKEEPDETDLIEFTFGDANEVTLIYDGLNYYHPSDPRAYTCPKCYEGAKGELCPGHKP